MPPKIPLNEKIRILSRITKDISYKDNYRKAGLNDLSQNQFMILRILYSSGSKSASEIADFLEISRAATSTNIEYLVKKKLVTRVVSKKDRRSVTVFIQSAGKKIIERYNKIYDQKINSILSNFNPNEKDLLNNLLDKYIYHLIEAESDFKLFCLQCGGKYDGNCPVGEYHHACYFQIGGR